MQELKICLQSPMQQHREGAHGKHTTKVFNEVQKLVKLGENQIHAPNTLQPNSKMQINPLSTKVEEIHFYSYLSFAKETRK